MLYGEYMECPKEAKSLVHEVDDLLMHLDRTHKKTLAVAKEDQKLKKLKAELKRVLKKK